MPNLERRKFDSTENEGLHRAGYSFSGSPASMSVGRTMRNSMSRRVALKRPRLAELAEAQEALATALEDKADEGEVAARRGDLELIQRRARAIAYIDPIDIRYRRFEPQIRPSAHAVMLCVMDVSASMSEHMKDIAKRFFMLLFVFLHKRYKKVEIVFIRHTDEAKEVDEQTFFHSTESGGTRVSSALALARDVVRERYPPNAWNIYVAQASDGDNDPRDNTAATTLLASELLPMVQYFAYLEISGLIPVPADQHWWAQSRKPMDMIRHGCSTSLFQASQQWSRMSS